MDHRQLANFLQGFHNGEFYKAILEHRDELIDQYKEKLTIVGQAHDDMVLTQGIILGLRTDLVADLLKKLEDERKEKEPDNA